MWHPIPEYEIPLIPEFDYKGKVKTHSILRLPQNEEIASVKGKETTVFFMCLLEIKLIKLWEHL